MNHLDLEVGQHVDVLVPYADRLIPCEAQVLSSAGSMLTISPPVRHRVKVPLRSAHIVLKVPRSDALYELRCPTEEVAADMWAIAVPGKEGTTRIQRRQFLRVGMSHACRLIPENAAGQPEGRSLACELVDLSGGGCAVRTDRSYELGTYLTLVCNLFEDELPLYLKGKVVRCTSQPDAALLGIEFRALGQPLQNALVHLVQTHELAKKQRGASELASTPPMSPPDKRGRRYDRSRFNDWFRP